MCTQNISVSNCMYIICSWSIYSQFSMFSIKKWETCIRLFHFRRTVISFYKSTFYSTKYLYWIWILYGRYYPHHCHGMAGRQQQQLVMLIAFPFHKLLQNVSTSAEIYKIIVFSFLVYICSPILGSCTAWRLIDKNKETW